MSSTFDNTMALPSAKDLDVTSEDMDNCPPGMTLSVMPPCREYVTDPMWFDQIGRDPIHARKIFRRSANGEMTREQLKDELAAVLEQWPRYGPAVYQKAAKEGRADVVEILIEMGVEVDPATMKNRARGSSKGLSVAAREAQSDEDTDDQPDEDTEDQPDTERGDQSDEETEDQAEEEDAEEVNHEEADEEVEEDEVEGGDDEPEEEDEDEPLYEPEHAYLTAIFEGHLDIVKLLVEKGGVPVNYEDPSDGLISIAYAATGGYVNIVRWLLDNGATVTVEGGPIRGAIPMDDIGYAIKGGSTEILQMLLSHPHVVAAGRRIRPDELPTAAWSRSIDMVRFILRSEAFDIRNPDTTLTRENMPSWSPSQREALEDAICRATGQASLESVKLLLKQFTPTRADGSFEPYTMTDRFAANLANETWEALEKADVAELYELLWETTLHIPPSPETIERGANIAPAEKLLRTLIHACAFGRLKTVRLLVEKYGADVNHVSYKYFTTPLGRAAGSGQYAVPGRLEVIGNLCSRPETNIELANGEYCNGETALALAVQEAHSGRARDPELREVVRLLLSYGGPVDEVDEELRRRCESVGDVETVEVYVLWHSLERRKPVKLSLEDREDCVSVVLEYSGSDLKTMVGGVKIRSNDEVLQARDPRERPCMPLESEEVQVEDDGRGEGGGD